MYVLFNALSFQIDLNIGFQVTFNNIENQEHILRYKEGVFTSNSIKLLHSCKYRILLSNDSKVFLSAFFSILRVLTHLTSESGIIPINSGLDIF